MHADMPSLSLTARPLLSFSQTAAQAEALLSLEARLAAAEEARDAALATAAARSAELDERGLCGSSPAARSRAHDAMLAARARARAAEEALEAANAAAEDATRKAQRLSAKVAVAEAEMGLLTAEKALSQTKLTVAEETAVLAAAACGGGALPERAEALRKAAAADAAAASAAVERARAAVTASVHRADAAFTATGARSAHSKGKLWHSRLELSYGDAADAGGGAALRALSRGPIKRRRASLARRAGGLLASLLWRIRYLGLLAVAAAAVIHVQTGSEDASGVAAVDEPGLRRLRELERASGGGRGAPGGAAGGGGGGGGGGGSRGGSVASSARGGRGGHPPLSMHPAAYNDPRY
jgi:hypothetical protein